MSNAKQALKAAKAAIDAQQWPEAATQAERVLAADPRNYHANVFLGLALDKQGRHAGAEKPYHTAADVKPKDPLAWQGLVNLYEQQGKSKLDDYGRAVIVLAEIYQDLDDQIRCQTVIDKFVGYAREHGSRQQHIEALEVMLPGSSVYDSLEGRMPHPSQTFTRIAALIETDEKERINKEIGERRTRLGAKLGQVTVEVKREVLSKSRLEHVYQSIIDWTNDDEVRREYEEKLLQRATDTLFVLPAAEKTAKRERVEELARGMVIIKHPFALAWQVVLEWRDGSSLADWDVQVLREYIEFFPADGLSKVLTGFLGSELSPFPADAKEDGAVDEAQDAVPEEEGTQALTAEERLLLMTDGIEEKPESHLALRLMAEYYLFLEEHESAVGSSRRALELVTAEVKKTGSKLQDTIDAITITLATALIYHETPRNHAEAKLLFEGILARKPTSTSALIGVGLILEEQEHFAGAVGFLTRAIARDPANIRIKAEAAWCKALDGDYSQALKELEACLPDVKGTEARSRALRATTLYRLGRCKWELEPSRSSRKDRKGAYSFFLAALQANVSFAPAYTSLGIYYADYARDKKRARKCFQKAFELSPSEVEAAERLARGFADQADWELVEAVAQRVVASGKVRPTPGSKRKGASWPFAALGVVNMNRQDYVNSIVSFQSALRISAEDYHSWVGLGESYHHSGRYIAATKAFQQAAKVEAGAGGKLFEESWFAKYMLANVKRELGDYDDAVQEYHEVLDLRADEFGVQMALAQTLVEGAWHSLETGFFGKAAELSKGALDIACLIAERRSDVFNLWKAVGDACSVFSFASGSAKDVPLEEIRNLLKKGIEGAEYDLLAEVDGVGKEILDDSAFDDSSSLTTRVLVAALLAQKRAVYASANEVHAQAVAWYNLGWTEQRAHECLAREARLMTPAEASGATKKASRHRKAAVRCFKRAIELEAGNGEFWNALGVATSQVNAKVSQHSFIRSLYLNDKNARVWTNLGALYVVQEDFQLANDAFTRAQSTDPDYAPAWLGQGLLASHLGDAGEARSLFTHAFEIGDSSSLLTQRQYAVASFDQLASTASTSDLGNLLGPLFALQQVRSQALGDLTYAHLSAMFLERIGDYISAVDVLTNVCSMVEQDYESSESAESLGRFAQGKADLARVQLAAHEYEDAVESADTALQLASEDTEDGAGGLTPAARRKCRLSAHLTAGLGQYYGGAMDEAIEMFRAALEESDGATDVVCLLAQVLWAKGGDPERTVAREQLEESVRSDEGHVLSRLLRGAVAMLDEDSRAMNRVTAKIHSLKGKDGLSEEQRRKTGKLLAVAAELGLQPGGRAAEAMTSVLLAPAHPHGWSHLAEVAGEESVFPAEMALVTAHRAVPPGGALSAVDLCRAFAGTGRVADAQRAVVMAPWLAEGWTVLAEGVAA
ncbi:MAG: Superkiller protein 3 [Thelocarpon impressellum]|nr:MAG: Superkiller protein 3 [Thelocarpon impressellum]